MLKSVQDVLRTFDNLRWKIEGDDRIAYAVCGLDKSTGDNTILLAMEDGARAPLHRHLARRSEPSCPLFRESITCLAGTLHGTDPHRLDFVLGPGRSIDLTDETPHQPYVLLGGFALVLYRQPGGHEILPATPQDENNT